MQTDTKKELTQSDLAQFTGTECYYAHWLRSQNGESYKYTEGVQYLAEKAGAYWLLDAIFSYRRKESFQIWELLVATGASHKSATLTMKEDTGQPILVTQKIEFTDFPLTDVKLWLIDGVLILPSEY